jgi:hypothetical protein
MFLPFLVFTGEFLYVFQHLDDLCLCLWHEDIFILIALARGKGEYLKD